MPRAPPAPCSGNQAAALPKSGAGAVEMIRHLKVARDTAVKGRTQAMLTLKAIIVSAPAALRGQLDRITGRMTLIRRLAALRPGPITSTTASAKASLRAIARRWLALDEEIRGHDAHLEVLTTARAPELVRAHGMGAGTAAAMLLLVGDNPERIRSEAAFAKLCGACPIPASSGRTTATGSTVVAAAKPTPPSTGSSSPACAAPADPRLCPQAYARREGEAGDHPLPEALRRPGDIRLPLRHAEAGGHAFRSRLTHIGASTRPWRASSPR
jgi:hypothetical protein